MQWPNHDYQYTAAKFVQALDSLVGNGELKERLFSAVITLTVIKVDDLPKALRSEYAELLEALTWVRLPPDRLDQGTLLSTLEAMTVEEAATIARKILHLYTHVLEAASKQ
jgi:hypothetical protein